MAFQLSPGVLVTEEDRSTVVPSVATTAGAFSGAFAWGPVGEVITVDSEGKLVEIFGKPNDTTAGYFFTAANFLSYGNNLQIVRNVNRGVAKNAASEPSGTVSNVSVTASQASFTSAGSVTVTFSAPPSGTTATGNVTLSPTANITGIEIIAAGFGYNTPPTVTIDAPTGTGAVLTATLGGGSVAEIIVQEPGNNYVAASNIEIQNQNSTSARANLVIHFKLDSIDLTTGGDNYTANANIQFVGGLVAGGRPATANLVLDANGTIQDFVITFNGNGYISAPNVIINRNDAIAGNNAVVAAANIGYGYIDRVIIVNPGAGGYAFRPNVTINRNGTNGYPLSNAVLQSRIEALVSSISITGGTGYTAPANVIITPNSNDIPYLSSNASALAVLGYTVQSVNITNPGSGYQSAPTVTIKDTANVTANATATLSFSAPLIENLDDWTTNHSTGGFGFGVFAARYPGVQGNGIKVAMADSATFTGWEYAAQFNSVPGTSSSVSVRGGANDELHVIVIDTLGTWSGSPNSVLEKFSFLSKASDAKNSDQSTNYYKDVIANQSRYIWVIDHPTGMTNWGSDSTTTFQTLSNVYSKVMSAGAAGDSVSISNVLEGYNLFANDELYDVSLIPMGPTTSTAAVNQVISIAENRRDCIVFASPQYTDVVNTSGQATKITTYRDSLTNSSFAVLDSGWKYQYDRYNDKYRYVPLNGDIAGLSARTDYIADPWFSPAGYNRGVVKNVVKLAWSPSKTDRDTLYKKGVNPVVTFPGQGTLLFGDKTLLARPSAFDRINVRRLFIVLEKAIATASKFQLFEFNDSFSQAQFRNLVEPFLRDVQGRRGITDFRVICDDTNNTSEVIDRNEFVADIFIKPARAINFIQLNFIATRSGVSFEEVGA
jgi:hypothetical protein